MADNASNCDSANTDSANQPAGVIKCRNGVLKLTIATQASSVFGAGVVMMPDPEHTVRKFETTGLVIFKLFHLVLWHLELTEVSFAIRIQKRWVYCMTESINLG